MENRQIDRNNIVEFLIEAVPEFERVIDSGEYCDRNDGVYVIIGAVSNRFNELQRKNIIHQIKVNEIRELENYYNFVNVSATSNDTEVENILGVSFFEHLDNDDNFIENMLSKLK